MIGMEGRFSFFCNAQSMSLSYWIVSIIVPGRIGPVAQIREYVWSTASSLQYLQLYLWETLEYLICNVNIRPKKSSIQGS
jgi:hypothetical protein